MPESSITEIQLKMLKNQMQKDDDFVPRQIAFTEDEYKSRLEKLRAAMDEEKIDVVLLSSPESQCWLHGYQARWYRTGSTTEWPPCNFTAVHVNKGSDITISVQGPHTGDLRSANYTIFGDKSNKDANGEVVSRLSAISEAKLRGLQQIYDLDGFDEIEKITEIDNFLVFDSSDHKDVLQFTSIAKGFCHFDDPDDPDNADATLKGVHDFLLKELTRQGWLPEMEEKDRARIGIEEWSPRQNAATTADLSRRLTTEYKKNVKSVEDVSSMLRRLQSIKTEAEIKIMKEAAIILDDAFERLQNGDLNVSPGNVKRDHSGDYPKAMRLHKEMTEIQVWAEMEWAMAQAGGETAALHNTVSRTRSYCHALSSTRPIGEGPLLLDPCAVKHRYHVNTARQFYLGKSVPEELVAASQIAADAFLVLDKLVRERLSSSNSLKTSEINNALKTYYQQANIWKLRDWLGGYQLGIAFTPDWVGEFNWNVGPEDQKEIKVGLVTNFESFVGGAGFIDTIHFTKNGIESLSSLPRIIKKIDNSVPSWWQPLERRKSVIST
jgi:Xaa-Pro aminopeptidase